MSIAMYWSVIRALQADGALLEATFMVVALAFAVSHGINRLALADPLELQTVMVGLGTPEGIGACCLLLSDHGELQQQLPKGFGDT